MKKLSKILILLLSVALIAGAIAVVASADAGVDNTVELYANDVLVEGVSTYEDALLTVQKGQAGGATYTVKLLGNLTTTTAWNTVDSACYNVETGTKGAGGDIINRSTTIDLNGYTMDVSGVNDYAFGSQRNYRAVTITGQGKLIVGSKGLLYSMSGAPMKVSGTGYGINIVNAEGATPWNKIAAAGSGCSLVFENCNIDFKYTATSDLGTNHVFNVENSTFKMVNCRMNLDVSKKFTAGSEGNGYVFRFRGTGFAQLTNTSITATTNGIYMDVQKKDNVVTAVATGQNKTFGGVADNYCLYMENSSLYLDVNQETYDYFTENKETITNLDYSLRTYLIIRSANGTDANSNVCAPTASIYVKDSYMGANYRLIQGQTTGIDDVLTDRTVLTFDHSTLEHINKGLTSVGVDVSGRKASGQGFFANITYTNFINKSTVEFNGIDQWNCGGGVNMTSLIGTKYVGVASTGDETGTYFVDLEAGTRLDKWADNMGTNHDKPAGTSAVQGSDGYYYIVANAEDIVCPPVKSSFTENVGVGGERMTGIITKNVEIGGVMASYKWALPSTQEQIDNGEVTVHAGNMSITDGKVVVDTSNTSYASIKCGMSAAEVSSGNYKVLVSSFDFYTNPGAEGTIPVAIDYAGNRGGGTKHLKTLNLNTDGTITGTNAKAGQWNTVSMVVDLGAKMLYAYVNGELVATQAEPNLSQLQDFRLQWANTTAVNAGAWIALDNGVCLKYADYFSGEFDPAKYLNGYKDASGKIFVGNTEYAEIDVALAATKTETGFNGFVSIVGDLVNKQVITNPGYIYTGDSKVELVSGHETIKINDLGNGAYYAERLSSYDTNFVVGETTYSGITLAGNTTAIPEGILTPDINGEGVRYAFLGWTTANVAYAGKTAEEYNAEVAAAGFLTTDAIADLTPTAPVTYYAAYTAITTYTVTFNVGGQNYTVTVDAGAKITLPDDIPSTGIIVNGALYVLAGWSTTEVTYADKTAKEYQAAITGITVLSEDVITAVVPTSSVTYYAVYDVTDVAYHITYGSNTYYYGEETDIADAITEHVVGNSITVQLYKDVTSNKAITAGGGFFRQAMTLDLNGKTLTVNNGGSNWASSASGGHFTVISSVDGGKLVQTASSTGVVFNVHLSASLTMTDVEVTANKLFYMTGGNTVGKNKQNYKTKVTLTGCTFTDNNTASSFAVIASSSTNEDHVEFTATDCVFIGGTIFEMTGQKNSGDTVLWFGNDAVFNSCTIIANDGATPIVTCAMTTNNVHFNDCKIYGTLGANNGNIYVSGTTAFYGMVSNNVAAATEGYAVAYVNPTTFTYDGQEYTTNLALAADGSYRTTTFYDLDGETVLAKVKHLNGVVATTLVNVAPTASIPVNAAMQYVWNGEWTKGVNKYTATKVLTYTEEFANGGAMVNLALTDGFDVYIYVAADYLEFYDAATKALLSEETMEIGGKQYYYLKAASLDANQGYTTASFTVVLTNGTNTVDVKYDVTVAAYLEAALALTKGDDQQLCYYIAKYLNDAYNYFASTDAETDADKATTVTFAELVDKYDTLNNSVSRPEVNTDYAGFVGTGSISIDLTSNPTFVIYSTAAGTVTFAGETYELVAGKKLEVSSLANRFDEVVTIVIGENTYTYCLGNYVANVEADEKSPAELKTLVASFYNYILFASKF